MAQATPAPVSPAAGKSAWKTSQQQRPPYRTRTLWYGFQSPRSGVRNSSYKLALRAEGDARELTNRLRQRISKHLWALFPRHPFYRVMLGPYTDAASARVVLGKLKRAGMTHLSGVGLSLNDSPADGETRAGNGSLTCLLHDPLHPRANQTASPRLFHQREWFISRIEWRPTQRSEKLFTIASPKFQAHKSIFAKDSGF